MKTEKMKIAAFDFDGTITYCDSFIPFLIYVSGPINFVRKMIKLLPKYFSYKIGKMTNESAKEAFLCTFFTGYEYSQLQSIGKTYAESILPRVVRKKMLKKIIWHQEQGHKCVLVSASLNVYLDYWARFHGMEVISTRLEIDRQGMITGKLQEKNCFGKEKERCLKEWLGNRPCDILYAYGDSIGDLEMLQMATSKIFRGKEVSSDFLTRMAEKKEGM